MKELSALYLRRHTLFIMLCVCVGGFSATAQSFLPLIHSSFNQNYSETNQAFVCADFNGDGKVDFAKTALLGDSSLQIYLGDGAGRFSFLQKLTYGPNGSALQCGDFNNDGKKDICIKTLDSVKVFSNDGTGHFILQGTYSLGVLTNGSDLLISDVNADGNADILCRRVGRDSLIVLSGNGHFGFTQAKMMVSANNSLNQYMEIKELRNVLNKYNDVITTGDFAFHVLHNDSTSRFRTDSSYSCVFVFNTLSVGDFNNDGYTDIACVSTDGSGYNGGLLTIYLNDGHDKYSIAHTYSIPRIDDPRYGQPVVSADFDGDHNIDIAYRYNDTVWFMMGDGSGGFHLNPSGFVFNSQFETMRATDVNGDGKTDIVTIGSDATGNNEGINVLLNGVSAVQPSSAIKISPATGGNCGFTTLTLWGSNSITQKIHVRLQAPGKPSINANDTGIAVLGTNVVKAQLSLDGAALGVYDLVITDSLGQEHLLPSAFTVQNCIPASTSIKIIGPDITRVGRNTIFYVDITNSGNCDALIVPVFLFIGGHNSVYFPDGVTNTDGTTTQPVSVDLNNYFGNDGPSKAYSLLLDKVPPDESIYLPVQITPEVPHEPFPVTGSTSPPLQHNPLQQNNDGSQSLSKKDAECINDMGNLCLDIAATALGKAFPVADCFNNGFQLVKDFGGSKKAKERQSLDFANSFVQTVVSCGKLFVPELAIPAALLHFYEALEDLNKGKNLLNHCTKCGINPFCNKDTKISEGQTSRDPNTKYGTGFGAEHWVADGETISYGISFENSDTARLAAQEISITDTLDVTQLDLSTFQSNLLQIGNRAIDLSYKHQINDTEFTDLRPGINLFLRTIVNLNQSTGALKILLSSLDPTTMQLTANPLLGFLPPDTLAPNGEGAYYYSVKLKPHLPHEAKIKNRASIVFDKNASILTPVWINTVDTVRPVSAMHEMPAFYNDTAIYLSWSGSDKGSGIQKYALYYSENNGPFTVADVALFDTNAIFMGKLDAQYQFYVEAIDNVNNQEIKHTAEVTTHVITTPIQLYPNPARDLVHVVLHSSEKISSVSLYNLSDQQLPSSYVLNSGNNATVQLPPNLLSGLYVLRIVTQNKIYHAKLIIQH
jgi:hypothetical protein